MRRISALFARKKERVLNMYCTAGFPAADSTREVLLALQSAGADIIELGMPYSDPLADGPVIQASSARALSNGMTIGKLFAQLKGFRDEIHIPVILMGYLNPLLQYGFEKFCHEAAALGIDGLIIPDIPAYAFAQQYGPVLDAAGLDFIFLVTPETSDERILQLDSMTTGFLYAVSSSSLTGTDKSFDGVSAYLQKLQSLPLRNPVMVGFGIRDKQSFETACSHAQGAIIGSAYIKAIENATDIKKTTEQFIKEVTG
jgi:tryptophan synthase alpha chain